MKAVPKRKGNRCTQIRTCPLSERASMKALPKRKGNNEIWCGKEPLEIASMKVPVEKRKNLATDSPPMTLPGLNESLHLKLQNKRSRGHTGGY